MLDFVKPDVWVEKDIQGEFSQLVEKEDDIVEKLVRLEVELKNIYKKYHVYLMNEDEINEKKRILQMNEKEKKIYLQASSDASKRMEKRYNDFLEGDFDFIYTNFVNNFYTNFCKKSSKGFFINNSKKNKIVKEINEKINNKESKLEIRFLQEVDPRVISGSLKLKYRLLAAELFIEMVEDGYDIKELIS